MVKRKREELQQAAQAKGGKNARFSDGAAAATKSSKKPQVLKTSKAIKKAATNDDSPSNDKGTPLSIQVVTGSYERVLHGFAATVNGKVMASAESDETPEEPVYSDTFLFAAHSSAVRCLAVSAPNESHKRVLATGSTDERINLFNVSTSPPTINKSKPQLPSLSATSVVENPRNRELGSLLHHSRSVNKLAFPTKGKLFSAADDNTIAISRARDWTVLSTIKAPVPKAVGRPSGDTAGPGEVPTGVNDFAVHPSTKVMVTVGKGERCMRLWNLVTGKKAGVLNFDKTLLQAAGEGKYSSGEGRKLAWSEDGEEYVVGFERGAVVYGMDSIPRAVIKPSPPTKLHQMRIVPAGEGQSILAISTEDGRILFYDLKAAVQGEAKDEVDDDDNDEDDAPIRQCTAMAQMGGNQAGFAGRIKDFEILVPAAPSPLVVVAAGSDGGVRLWKLDLSDIQAGPKEGSEGEGKVRQVGTLVGTHETGRRITCLTAFIMDGPPEGEGEGEEEDEQAGAQQEESSGEDSG